MFKTEQDLVNCFVTQLLRSNKLRCEVDGVQLSAEFDYIRGRTDLVALSLEGELLAFEAKLTRWRIALHQAYRNTCFSDRSYVVLPLHVALRAAEFEQEFAIRKVGLCGISDGTLHVLLNAPRSIPTEPWLGERAREHIRVSRAHVAA